MTKTFNKIAMGLIASSLLTVTAVNAQDISQEGDKASISAIDAKILENQDNVLAALESTMKNSTQAIQDIPLNVSEHAMEFAKQTGLDYIPVHFGGRRLMAGLDGAALMDPNSFWAISKDGIKRVSDILVKLDFTSSSSEKWPSSTLPEGVTKTGDVFVITDPTCGYCQKVDSEASQYAENGVVMHYIPYPRSGVNPSLPAYQKWAAALCSEDPAKAYHDIMMGNGDKYPVPDLTTPSDCTNLIQEGYDLGGIIGISGTPYMYAIGADGQTFSAGGYVPFKDLANEIGVKVKDNGLSTIMR